MCEIARKLIGGHRGSPKEERENTIKSFERAIALKVDFVEFDVRFSKDKKAIVHHDPNINSYLLKDMNYSEIVSLSQSLGYRVPLLEEVLQTCFNKTKVDIEVKEAETTLLCINKALNYFTTSEFIITSFNTEVLEIVKDNFQRVKTGLLFDTAGKLCLKEKIVRYKPDYILPSIDNFDYFTLELSEFIKENLIDPRAVYWNVNSEEDILKTLSHPYTFGIISDFPAKAVAANLALPF